MAGGRLCRSAEVVGTVRFVSQNAAGAVLELGEANERINVFCGWTNAAPFRRYLHLRLRARGVCEGILNEQSTVVAGRLWTPDSESVSLAEPTDTEWNAFPVTPIARLHPALGPFPDVIRVRGTVAESDSGQGLILSEDYRTLHVQLGIQQKLPPGGQVEALGFLGWREQAPVLLQASIRSVAATNADPQAGQVLLTHVEQILRLPPNEQELTYDARIRGVVTSPSGYVNDDTGGIFVERLEAMAGRPGDFVEVFGHAGSGQTFGTKSYSPVILADGIRVLGRGRWPEPKTFSWNYLMTGQPDGQWIEVTGIGRSANTNVLTLSVEGGQLQASVPDAKPEDMNHWIDASLRIRGVYRAAFNQNGQFQGFSVDVPDLDCVQIDKPPPSDPFAIPAQKAGTLLTYDPLEKLAHRRKVAGVVSHSEEKFFFIQDSSGGLQVQPSQPARVYPGDAVEVVGFPRGGGFSPTLVEALVRKTGTERLPTPVRIHLEEVLRGEHEGSFVSLEAILLGQKLVGSTAILEMQAQQKTFRALLRAGALPGDNYPPGSRVELRGVFKVDRKLDERGAQRVSAFDFLLNNAGDVLLLERPTWWTAGHTLESLVGLAAVLLVSLVWAGSLRKRVRERTRELRLEIDERKRAEEELKSSRDLLNTLLENSPDLIYFKDRESRFVCFSTSFRQLFRLADPEVLRGKTDFDFFTEEHARPAFEDEQEIIRTGKPLLGKIEKETHPDGRVTWALTSKLPWRDKDGKIIGTFGLSQSITSIKETEAKLEAAHRQLVEVSRQAGMAEVATSVLHNVGNVLNSINVTTTLLNERVRKSRVSDLARLAKLLGDHSADLGKFLTTDPKGGSLPGFIDQLARRLVEEQTLTIEELESLRKHIEHINDIVAMQQSYAKISGAVDNLEVTELVEDALRMNASGFARHDVRVVREYSPLPPICTDKHKVLQILINLIRNAKNACNESGRDDKQVIVRVNNDEERVRISVIDNGVGIPSENLTRIFNHGFTTRKDGHGFGLHSGALAAKELGGSLTTQSDGPGKGATFVIELPKKRPQSSGGTFG